MWVLLRGGRVLDPSQDLDVVADVLIEDGRISAIGPGIGRRETDGGPDKVYDVSGKVVVPGLIDMHVHLREPGFEHKETIETGSRAAAAGGFTAVVAMPNTQPPVDSRPVVEYVLNTARRVAAVNVYTAGAVTKGNSAGSVSGGIPSPGRSSSEEMAELADIVAAGAVALSDDAFPVQNADLMRRIMEYTRMLDVPVLTHCEDKTLSADGVMNEGIVSTMVGLRGIPAAAEVVHVWRNILLAELAKCRLHIQHVSTAGAVEAVRWAKHKGLPVTCETCPHYFSLTDEALCYYDTSAKTNPPLRTQKDVEAILEGLADGTIDVIATDHAPHAREDKEVDMTAAAFGMVGLETAVPLVLTKLVGAGVMSLSQAVQKMTVAPAKILGLPLGTLREGAPADLTVLDLDAPVTVRSAEFQSKGRNTPFEGWELKGNVAATIVGGRLVYGNLPAFRESAAGVAVGPSDCVQSLQASDGLDI